jgi:DNA-binding transcriptional LysR family regulator
VTRHLRVLETAVGVPLLSRTTRRVTVTDEGSRFHAQCVQILRLVDLASEEARSTRGAPTGTIRISCTAALGVLHVSRLIFAFQDLYPDIAVDLSLSDERIDLVRDGVDIALRLGPLTDSSLKLKPLGQSRRLLVAAPQYLAGSGVPAHPRDLGTHEGIRMSNIAGSDLLILEGRGERHALPFGGRLQTDHGLAVREALAAGRGIAPAHLWLVEDLLAARRLVRVLPDYAPPPVPLNMLIVPERAGIARVRLLVDFLAERITQIAGIETGGAHGGNRLAPLCAESRKAQRKGGATRRVTPETASSTACERAQSATSARHS